MAERIVGAGSGALLLNAVAATGRSDTVRLSTMASIRVTITGTATVDIEKSVDGSNRKVMATLTASGDYVTDEPGLWSFNVTAFTSGTISASVMT